jgi:hypothetical protein
MNRTSDLEGFEVGHAWGGYLIEMEAHTSALYEELDVIYSISVLAAQ